MARQNESFDKRFLSDFLAEKLTRMKEEKNLTAVEIADKIGVSYQYISNMLNGRTIWNTSAFRKIGIAMGLSETQMENLIIEAKKAELEHSHGIKLAESSGERIEDFEVALSREYGISDKEAIEDIKLAIDFIRHKYGEKSDKPKHRGD